MSRRRGTGPTALLLALILLCLVCWSGVAAAQNEQPIKIGVLGNSGKEAALVTWSPLAEYLGQTLKKRFVIEVLDFATLYPEVAAGNVDFVIANTGQYVEMEVLYGLTRLATINSSGPDGDFAKFGGVVFTRAENKKINTLQDLRGRRVAAVDQTSFGGWLVHLREFTAAGLDPADFAELKFSGTHPAVVRSVLQGEAEVGLVRTDILERMAQDGKLDLLQIKIINDLRLRSDVAASSIGNFPYRASTRLYPEWPFAKLRHTEDKLAHQVAAALLNLPAGSAAARAAKSAGWTIPGDYTPVHDLYRELKLGPYRDMGKFSLQDVLKRYWPVLLLSVLLVLVLAGATVFVARANRRLGKTLLALDHEKNKVEMTLEELTATHDELSVTHAKLERSNQLVLESIRYARRIQESLLPDPQALQGSVADIAVRWEPLQVVGGDYYWLQQIEGRCVVVVADCTGHGVPGALLTTVLSTALERIIRECRPLEPAAMLEAIDAAVRTRLRQDCSDCQSDDGLEAAICIYDPQAASLTYSGAGIPLLLMQEGAIREIKATRSILGYGSIRSEAAFAEHVLAVVPGMAFYLFTDGAPDHMGGARRQLLGRKRLAEVVVQNAAKPLDDQLTAVCDYLETYRGDERRRDDMTMVAFRPL